LCLWKIDENGLKKFALEFGIVSDLCGKMTAFENATGAQAA